MARESEKSRLLPALVAGSVVPLLLIFLAWLLPHFAQVAEAATQDLYFASTRSTGALNTVAVVGFDDRTLAHFDWKARLDHRIHAKLVKQLTKAGAKAIGFDFAFLQEDPKDPAQHQIFADACREMGHVVIGSIVTEDEKGGEATVKKPIADLATAVQGLGILYHPLDTDSVIRRATMCFPTAEKNFYPLSLRSFLAAEDLTEDSLKRTNDGLTLSYGADDIKIPLDENGNLLIWYAGPSGTIPTHSYLDVLEGKFPEAAFKDRTVFVGPTAKIFQDFRLVPTFSHGTNVASLMSGVEIHANTFLTIVEGVFSDGSFLGPLSHRGSALLMVAAGLTTALACSFLEIYISWLVPLVFAALYLFVSHHFLFLNLRLLPPLTGPVVTIAFTYLALVIYRYLDERRRRKTVRSMFEHFVPSHVVARLEQDPAMLQAPGRNLVLTVLFSDIRNFTPLAERLGAEKTVRLLNKYFEVMTEVILSHNGMIDKFIGDAILAVFGEPVTEGNHAEQAVQAAMEMRKALKELNTDSEFRDILDDENGLDNGIAVNTGSMIVGNLGALKRKDYTVIGDAVNLCSRLEGLAKGENPRIILSSSTYEETKHFVEARSLGKVKVKGISEAVLAYGIDIPALEAVNG